MLGAGVKIILCVIVGLVLLYVLLQMFFGLSTKVRQAFNTVLSIDSVENYIEKQESALHIEDEQKKEIVWHEGRRQTEVALVYIHGFVANKNEIRPVPDNVAKKLSANIFYTRLRGHGREAKALENAEFSHWIYDVQEAIEIGKVIGKKVVLISTSTGGTLVTRVLQDEKSRKDVLGSIFVSPNYKIKDPLAFALFLPFGKHLALLANGKTKGSTKGVDETLLKHWHWEYPTVALMPMATAVKAFREQKRKLGLIDTPALFIYSSQDDTVSYKETLKVAKLWGGPAQTYEVKLRDGMNSHVFTGNLRGKASVNEVSELMYTSISKWLSDKNKT